MPLIFTREIIILITTVGAIPNLNAANAVYLISEYFVAYVNTASKKEEINIQ